MVGGGSSLASYREYQFVTTQNVQILQAEREHGVLLVTIGIPDSKETLTILGQEETVAIKGSRQTFNQRQLAALSELNVEIGNVALNQAVEAQLIAQK